MKTLSPPINKNTLLAGQIENETPYDLSGTWLDTLPKHIFPEDNAKHVSFDSGNAENTFYYIYRVCKKRGILNSTSILPIANYYTTYNYPVYQGEAEAFFRRFFDHIQSAHWDTLEFGPTPSNSSQLSDIIHSVNQLDLYYSTFHQHTNWYLLINNRTFNQYFDSLPQRVRSTIKRKARKLEKEPTAQLTIYSGQEAKTHICEFHEVYEQSWKPEESHPKFITEIMEKFSANGWIRLGFVYLNSKPIATQFWIVKDHIAYIYKLSHVEGYKKFSAGTLLTSAMMEYVIDYDKVTSVDFLTGDDPYKRDWMSHSRELVGIRIYNKTIKGFLLSASVKLKKIVRDWIKGSQPYG